MNIKQTALLVAAALSLCTLADARSAGQDVHFANGAHSAQYTGAIRGYNYDSYFFTAKRGQRLSINLKAPALDAVLFSPKLANSVMLNDHGSYILPVSGRYELRVLQMRNDARRNLKQNYRLNFEIR